MTDSEFEELPAIIGREWRRLKTYRTWLVILIGLLVYMAAFDALLQVNHTAPNWTLEFWVCFCITDLLIIAIAVLAFLRAEASDQLKRDTAELERLKRDETPQ
jgi:hypothetical protein